jgi:arabinofuranosyltransferase
LLVARYAYFGSFVPNTYYAKITPNTLARLRAGALYLGRFCIVHSPLFLVAATLYGVASKRGVVPGPGVAFLVGWIALWSLYIVYAGGDHFAMFRFFLPVLPACALLIGLLWQPVRPHVAPAWEPRFKGILAFAILLASVGSILIGEGRARGEPELARMWGRAGKWIAENTPTDTLLATNVIGAIGYFSKRRIVDMAGLVDPVVAREGAVYSGAAAGHACYNTDHVFARAPDLVVYYTSGASGRPPFTRVSQLAPQYHFSMIQFLLDPRCAERYEHISVPLSNGAWLEMQKKRTFALPPGYLTAAP